MKKIKEITIPATEKHTKKVETICCDICGFPNPEGSTYNLITKCHICNRDIHFGYNTPCSHSDPNYDGDYPPHYCKYCFPLRFKKYSSAINDIEEEAERKKDAIIERIKNESLNEKT